MSPGETGGGLLLAALDYAGRAWYVFPCRRDKTPATKHGVKDATIDAVQVRRWWIAHPNASIGIACGPSGLVVIDIDAKYGGLEGWKKLKEAHGIDDATWTSITGGGGQHLVYRAPAGFRGRNSAGKLGPGLDVRADGGYIIAPPSWHPSGSIYRWEPEHLTREPLMLPDSLRALLERLAPKARASAPPAPDLRGPGWAAAALRSELSAVSRAAVGARNDTLNHAAYSLGQIVAGGDLGRIAVEQKLLAAAQACGLDEHEALVTIRSGLAAGSRTPRAAPVSGTPAPDEPPAWLDENGMPRDEFSFAESWEPEGPPSWPDENGALGEKPFFPPSEPAPAAAAQPAAAAPAPDLSLCPPLPEAARLGPELGRDASPWLDAYIDFSRRWAPAAYDGFHEAVGLWVLSTVAARRVKLDFGGERYPSLYIANVARSSLWTKSTAHHIGSALLESCGLSFLLAPDESTPQALLYRMSVPPTVTDWDARPVEERERARLALAFAGQKGWDYDEFGSKVSAMMRDSGPMADFRGILRRFDDAPERYIYDTVARGENRLARPYLALLASMPPANMAPYARRGGALWHDGFWARFAFVAPARGAQPPEGEFPEGQRVIPDGLLLPLRAWHERLGAPAVEIVQRKDADGKPTRDFDVTVAARPPHACTLGAGVWEAFYRYHNELRRLAAASDNTDLDANYTRFGEKALRVAILLASLDDRGPGPAFSNVIELRHWARGQEIAERWRQSLHNLYTEINAEQDEEGQREDRVIGIVRRLGKATPADVHRRAPDISTSEAVGILDRLTRAGALQIAERSQKDTPRYCVSES